jgi:hypothetical protein
MSAELELTSWRRMVGELYAAVRGEEDPQHGHALWRHGRDDLFRSHPQSPLPPGDPLRMTGLPYWPYDSQLRFDVPLLPADRDMSLSVPTSEGAIAMARLGRLYCPHRCKRSSTCGGCSSMPAACSCRCAMALPVSPVTAAAGTCSTPPKAPTLAGNSGS